MKIQNLITKLTTMVIKIMMMIMNKRSTRPGLPSLAQHLRPTSWVRPTMAANNMRCKPCNTSRAGCQIPLMRKPLCLATSCNQKTNSSKTLPNQSSLEWTSENYPQQVSAKRVHKSILLYLAQKGVSQKFSRYLGPTAEEIIAEDHDTIQEQRQRI